MHPRRLRWPRRRLQQESLWAKANSFLVVDVTQLVKEWLNGSANGGIDNDGIALVADTSTTYVVLPSPSGIRFDELGSHKQCPEFHAKMQMIFDFLGELSTLVVTSKCATLKGESERFAGRSVPRGADNFLAHRRG